MHDRAIYHRNGRVVNPPVNKKYTGVFTRRGKLFTLAGMEKIVVTARTRTTRNGSTAVRIDLDTYRRLKTLSTQSGHSMVELLALAVERLSLKKR